MHGRDKKSMQVSRGESRRNTKPLGRASVGFRLLLKFVPKKDAQPVTEMSSKNISLRVKAAYA